MKTLSVFFLALGVTLVSIAPSTALADNPSSYLVAKGGFYSPSNSYNIDNVQFNTKDGFVAGGALGHYFMPFLAIELEGGYLESTTSSSLPGASTKLNVYPALATGKFLLPLGPVEPYGEFGLGVYIVNLDISGTPHNYTGSAKGTFGYHAGGGVNINLGSNFFLGAEGRYRWATQSYGGEDIKLNGFTVTGDIGIRF